MADVRFVFVAAVNDDAVLEANLLRSPTIADGAPILLQRGYESASLAYNAALDEVDADLVVFTHQDMYLPDGWDSRLASWVRELRGGASPWAVLGILGMGTSGEFLGRVWSTGLGEIGEPLAHPAPAVSLDEIVLVVRPETGIRFDGALPGYHLYGTDIAQTALAAGFGAYVVDAPAVHNTIPVHHLDGAYRAGYDYMRRKWRSELPLPTSVVPITRSSWPLARYWLRVTKGRLARRLPPRTRDAAPTDIARALGYEQP